MSGVDRLRAMLAEKKDKENLGYRTIGKQSGVPFTSLNRFMVHDSYLSVDNIVRLCEWLGVSPAMVLDGFGDNENSRKSGMIAIMQRYPALEEVLLEIESRVTEGELDPEIIDDVAQYAEFILNREKERWTKKNEQRNSTMQ